MALHLLNLYCSVVTWPEMVAQLQPVSTVVAAVVLLEPMWDSPHSFEEKASLDLQV